MSGHRPWSQIKRKARASGAKKAARLPGTLEPRRTDQEQVIRAYAANLAARRRLP
jgi:hypothetical protein